MFALTPLPPLGKPGELHKRVIYTINCAGCATVDLIDGAKTYAEAANMAEGNGWDLRRGGWFCRSCVIESYLVESE